MFILGIACTLGACSDDVVDVSAQQAGGQAQNGKADDVEQGQRPSLDSRYLFTIESELVLGQTDSDKTTEVTAAVGGIAQVQQTDNTVLLTLTPCSIELPKVEGRELEIGEDAVGAIPAIDVTGTFAHGETGYLLHLDPSAFIAGAELNDVLTDTLPTDKRDDRLVDVDQDNRAGITLKILGHSIYGSLRLVFSTSLADVKGSQEWMGAADLAMDFYVVDDSVPFVDVQDKLDEALAELTVDEQDNRFRLIPMAVETELSCIGVAEQLSNALPEPGVSDSEGTSAEESGD